jgi:hypothetical protein
MSAQFNNQSFKQTLSKFSVALQRQVAARFIQNVLDLADERCLQNIANIAAKPDIGKGELEEAYHLAHSIYVKTNPHSGMTELDFAVQAKHFVAEACMTCLSPCNEEDKDSHLAQKVAMYCRMARTCASVAHEAEIPDFNKAEMAMRKTIEAQYAILQAFLDER